MLVQAAQSGDTLAVRFPYYLLLEVCVFFLRFQAGSTRNPICSICTRFSLRTVFRLVLCLNIREVNMSDGVYWEIAVSSPLPHASNLSKTHKQFWL